MKRTETLSSRMDPMIARVKIMMFVNRDDATVRFSKETKVTRDSRVKFVLTRAMSKWRNTL